MGLRLGWWGKWGGITWGRSGFRIYGYGRGGKKSGSLIPFVLLAGSGFFLLIIVAHTVVHLIAG